MVFKKSITIGFVLGLILLGSFLFYRIGLPKLKNDVGFLSGIKKIFPQSAAIAVDLADSLQQEKDFNQALQEYQSLSRLKREGLPIEANQNVEQNIKKVDRVIEYYKEAIAQKGDYWPAYLKLAALYEKGGKPEDAFNVYVQLVKKNPKLKEGHFRLAFLYGMMGDFKRASGILQYILRNFSKEEDSFLVVVSVYNALLAQDAENVDLKAGRTKAIDGYVNFVNKNPPKDSHYFNLGVIYHEKGDLDRALSAYQMALQLNPRHSKSAYNIGNIYKDQGLLKDALGMYKKSVQFDPKFSNGYLNIGLIEAKMGNLDQAKKQYKKAIDANPQNTRAYFNLGLALVHGGYLTESIEVYNQAIKLDSGNPDLFYSLGKVYSTLKNFDEAQKAYLKAVELSPNRVDAWVGLAAIAYEKKDYAKALQYIEEAQLLGFDFPQKYIDELKALQQSSSKDLRL